MVKDTRHEARPSRDLFRDRLNREEAEEARGEVVAVVTLVYELHARELSHRLIENQHHHHDLVISTLHVHLGIRHCLEVSILRGEVGKFGIWPMKCFTKGVLHGERTFTSGEKCLTEWA